MTDNEKMLEFINTLSEQNDIKQAREANIMAKTNRQIYEAHIKAGFTPKQAMEIVNNMITASIMSSVPKK